ncbi:hypothetical protein RJ640_010686 [Escallonia rubra]|uniref:Uncharacterized protein n=1 Tax=Escallonia rubra TaxID=112253 RepID=A0AA88RR46_9ASTE|nr:hypothetical protein RJ640_010686 [Escallonia rubra]
MRDVVNFLGKFCTCFVQEEVAVAAAVRIIVCNWLVAPTAYNFLATSIIFFHLIIGDQGMIMPKMLNLSHQNTRHAYIEFTEIAIVGEPSPSLITTITMDEGFLIRRFRKEAKRVRGMRDVVNFLGKFCTCFVQEEIAVAAAVRIIVCNWLVAPIAYNFLATSIIFFVEEANMLYLETPIGVGFSYTTETSTYVPVTLLYAMARFFSSIGLEQYIEARARRKKILNIKRYGTPTSAPRLRNPRSQQTKAIENKIHGPSTLGYVFQDQ